MIFVLYSAATYIQIDETTSAAAILWLQNKLVSKLYLYESCDHVMLFWNEHISNSTWSQSHQSHLNLETTVLVHVCAEWVKSLNKLSYSLSYLVCDMTKWDVCVGCLKHNSHFTALTLTGPSFTFWMPGCSCGAMWPTTAQPCFPHSSIGWGYTHRARLQLWRFCHFEKGFLWQTLQAGRQGSCRVVRIIFKSWHVTCQRCSWKFADSAGHANCCVEFVNLLGQTQQTIDPKSCDPCDAKDEWPIRRGYRL